MHSRLLVRAAWVLGVLLWAGTLRAENAALPEEIVKLREGWKRKLLEGRQEVETAKADLLQRYRKALEAARQGVQQQGDLEGVQAIDGEIKAFEKRKALPGADVTIPLLARTIQQAHEAWNKAEWEAARKTQEGTDLYLQALEQRVKQAVREDHLELARAYDSERKAAREAPEYQSAKFVLAEKAAETGKPAPTGAVAVAQGNAVPAAVTNQPPPLILGQDRDGKNGQKLTPRTDPEGLYDALQLKEGNTFTALGEPLVTYKSLPVSETGKVPMFDSVGIAAEGFMEEAAEEGMYRMRFRLRAKNLNAGYPALKVLVQYFVKNPAGTGIREAQTLLALMPALGARGVLCEMKPAKLPYSYISRGRTLGSAERNRKVNAAWAEDREPAFAGVVISVYAMDDKLLGQVCSSTTLKERGKAAFLMPEHWMQRVRERPADRRR